tara:strand:- start:2122 stop:2322 length:201 start_codon:yes stop_codon:yes gene_type:complete
VRLGELISYKPIGFGREEWSNPSIVVEQCPAPNEGLIVVYDSGEKFYIDDENYEIVILTSSSLAIT